MATKLSELLFAAFPDLRYQPTSKRIRADVNGSPVVDTREALLVWEPKRVTPVYAVPEKDLLARLERPAPEGGGSGPDEHPVRLTADAPPVLDPRTGFRRHTTNGDELDVHTTAVTLPHAAFRPSDPDLAGYVVLDFRAFHWQEDEEEIIGHPRDPFHRVDIRATLQRVEVMLDGVKLADTVGAQLLYETMLPVRYYIPPENVRLDLLEASQRRTICPYKGEAKYWSFPGSERGKDIAWAYDSRYLDAQQIHGLVCFFNERADIAVDGALQPHPVTPWS
ncbi:DUF427 domain-containing protein [Arthrobacter sp. NPDC093139]|uniref:DUF427 domain-containing protein n=1 Tax=Arthrobacter sp. NPDC093139 TaxID=3363945 RepID=UPI00382D6870